MFHAGGHKGVGGRARTRGIGRQSPHYLAHLDWKAPVRCGVIFTGVSCMMFVVGVILTWLGVHDVFGESVPITGPILLSVGGLMLILAIRQFYIAHTRKRAHNLALAKKELGENTTAAKADHGDENDSLNPDRDVYKDGLDDPNVTGKDNSSEKPPLISEGCCDSEVMGPINNEGYMWPPLPVQDPYYSMAMMIYKDAFFSPSSNLIPQRLAETSSYSPAIASGIDVKDIGIATDRKLSGGASVSLSCQPHDSATLAISSTTLHHQTQATMGAPLTSMAGSRQECSKIFPADYLKPRNVTHGSSNNVISSLSNPTAFMMIRTLELQETI